MSRRLELVIALGATVASLPLLALAALAVKLFGGRGPVLFRQERAGLDGQTFELVKLRTMRGVDPHHSADDERRITRVGRFLRRTSLDELPSLLGVLRGELALVGPRPLPVRYVDRYTNEERQRLAVRPGITGWAQINGRNSTTWPERLEQDVWYVDHRSTWLDLKILVGTVRAVVVSPVSHLGHATMPEFGPPTD